MSTGAEPAAAVESATAVESAAFAADMVAGVLTAALGEGMATPAVPLGKAAKVPRVVDTHSASVYRVLRQRLVTGTVAPGTRLTELDLAADLGVSRTPVREALRRLESDGFVQRVPGTGLVAAPMGPDDIGDIGLLRVEIEGIAARLAVARATTRDWARLKGLCDAFLDVEDDDVDGLNATHLALHRAIYEIAFSPRLHGFLENYLLPYLELSFNVGSTSPEHSHRQHTALLRAMSRGDVDKAVEAAREHAQSGARVARTTLAAPLDGGATKSSRSKKSAR